MSNRRKKCGKHKDRTPDDPKPKNETEPDLYAYLRLSQPLFFVCAPYNTRKKFVKRILIIFIVFRFFLASTSSD